MKASRRWLEAFLRRPLELRELTERLAMCGMPVDGVTPLHAELKDIVIALVEDVRQHPNADRLRLCLVNDGTAERKHVVCGANNVTAGNKYPFAPVGSSLPGGITIERRKIRGEPSEGMLCSSRELGLGTEHDGLMTLATEAEPGQSFLDSLGLGDHTLELDISAVRGDLLGHKGIARELAAGYKTQFRLPEIPGAPEPPVVQRSTEPASVGGITVKIEPGSACRRFTAAVIRGVQVGPSPEWLRTRLAAIGQRSINNVVDATNYVMFELGQPLHAYDYARVSGGTVMARLAKPGEKLVTLDGSERTLPDGSTVIADGNVAVGVGGVMGGRDSEVTDGTSDLFLECAWFEPAPTRKARRTLNLPTEASQRFERGTDLWAVPDALRRCCQVLVAVAGGRVEGEAVDVWPETANPPRIFVRARRVAQILGVELPMHELERCLVAVGCTVVAKPAEERLSVEAPGWRPDIREEIDLVEEVARVYGYEKFPDELRPFRAGNQVDAAEYIRSGDLRRHLSAEGLYEVQLLPLGPEAQGGVPVLNPLSADHSYLRSSLLPGILRQVEANWSAQTRDIRLFEIGVTFAPGGSDARPVETTRVAGIISGTRSPAHWTDSARASDSDQWDLKGLFERAVSLAIPAAAVQVKGEGWVAKLKDGREVGHAGPLSADAPPWAAPVYGFEVNLDLAPRPSEKFRPVPSTPAASRDVAVVVPDKVSVAEILSEIAQGAGTLLDGMRVLSEYRGSELPAGTRSVAIRVVLRGKDRTLRDSDVDAVLARILNKLGQSLDVTLRAT